MSNPKKHRKPKLNDYYYFIEGFKIHNELKIDGNLQLLNFEKNFHKIILRHKKKLINVDLGYFEKYSSRCKTIIHAKANSLSQAINKFEITLACLRMLVSHNVFRIGYSCDDYIYKVEDNQSLRAAKKTFKKLPVKFGLTLRPLYKTIEKFYEKNDFIITKYNDACDACFDNIIINSCITLESTLMHNDKAEIGYKLAIRGLVILSEIPSIIKHYNIFNIIKTLYNLRSDIIHGAKHFNRSKNYKKLFDLFKIRKDMGIFEFDNVLLSILSNIILIFILNSDNFPEISDYIRELDNKIIDKVGK